MAKVTPLNDIASLANTASAKQALNENFQRIEDAFENTLSRDGSTPNQMEADLDMNSNDILNAGSVDASSYLINGVPFEQTVAYANKSFKLFSGTGAQLNFLLDFDPGSLGNLEVSVKYPGEQALEILRPGLDFNFSGTTLSFTVAPPAGTNNILVRYDQALPTGVTSAEAVLYTPPSTGIAGSIKSFLDSLWTASETAGAALIRFLAAGVGAVARTLQDKNRDIVSALDFMTPAQIADVRAGTISVDVTAAVQAAINALPAAGGKLYFPAGRYLLSATLTITNKTVVLYGDGMDVSILEWRGVGMTGVDGIQWSHTQQVPFLIERMSLVAAPNPASVLVLAGKAVRVVCPAQNTVFAPTFRMEKVYIRPHFTGDSWNPTRVGGWAECAHITDTSNCSFIDCEFVSNINANVTYGVHVTSNTNTVVLLFEHCNFGNQYKSFYSDGTQSVGGIVFSDCSWVGVNIGIDISLASDMVQVDSCYMQAFTWGVRSLARTTMITNNRFDMDPDPFGRYTPVAADAIVLGNTFVALDGSCIKGNNFGGSAATKNAVRCTQGVQFSVIEGNTIGAIALYGTAYAVGIILEAGSNDNNVTDNRKVNCTNLVLDLGTGNVVYGNVPSGMLAVTGQFPVLRSGVGNVVLDELLYLTQPGATVVLGMFNGFVGQKITLVAGDANSTIQNNANMRLNGGVNFAMPANATLSLQYDGTMWREVGRAV